MNFWVKRGSERIKATVNNKEEWNALRHCSGKGVKRGVKEERLKARNFCVAKERGERGARIREL